MKRRAFTLIELMIVLCILGILLVPVGYMATVGYQSFTMVSLQASSKADCQRSAEAIFRLAARNGGFQVDKDNHGLTFADGSKVRWQGDRLELTQGGHTRSLLVDPVREFTAVRHDQRLTLNLAIDCKRHAHGKAIRLHEIYDYPRVGLP